MEKTTQVSSPIQVKEKITYEEFLPQVMDVHAERGGGEVIKLMTASDRHQDIVDWLWQDPLPKVLDVVKELGLLE